MLRRNLLSTLGIVAIFTTPVVPICLAAPLLSPWDSKTVTVTDKPYACPAIPKLAADLTTDGFYRTDDPTHSIIDPVRQAAYNASAGPVKDEGMVFVAAADAFRATGSRQAADCVRSHLLALAQQNSLAGKMSSGQAFYVQGWIAGVFAIDYLKVRSAAPLSAEQTKFVGDWLHHIGSQTEHFYDDKHGHNEKGNNHLYWAGVELAAIGILADRHDDFDWGLSTYDNGINQIRPDGTLPLELARGTKALHYHLYAVAPLVMLAEFGTANHLDLYAHANGAIHRLVDRSIGGIANPGPFDRATNTKQEVPKNPSGDAIGWAPPYVRRFPDPVISQYIANAHTLSVFYLGGLPPE